MPSPNDAREHVRNKPAHSKFEFGWSILSTLEPERVPNRRKASRYHTL